MSEEMKEDEVEALRRDIGEKWARDGVEEIHDYSSESAKAGYRRGAIGFGYSNVIPKKFGRTGQSPPDWVCICGNINKGSVRVLVANRVVCGMCGIEKDLALEAKDA
jgi:hypothetical protein